MEWQIYIDMDGVLCDFDYGALILHKKLYGMFFDWNTISSKTYFDNIENHSPDFFINLKWMPRAKNLWNYIKEYQPIIITAVDPSEHNWINGKRQWVDKHLGSHVEIIFERNKYLHANKNSILIDDQAKRTEPWKRAGGSAILHTKPSRTIRRLRRLGVK